MNRDQLRLALGHAVERHARTLQDHGGRAGPALLDDLEHIADEHAAGAVKARRTDLIAMSTVPSQGAPQDDTEDSGTPTTGHPSARTRTRTRRNTE